ncbi:MAG: hypothetical protein KGJ36_09540 [Acidobacteriota bacterium]|nr:hypothetical protein [Acidobacteriota bacterium]
MTHGLPPRPTLPEDELAAVIAAAEEVLRQEVRRVPDSTPSWRFSGRWFNSGPFHLRRPIRPA